jgi:copper chaperone CopZ
VERVRETLKRVDGVEQVEIDFSAKTATVTMQPGKSLTREECEQAFQDTRYRVAAFRADSGAAHAGGP